MYYEELFNQLKEDEGVRYAPYKCPADYWTVGVGRNLESNPLTPEEQQLIFGKQVVGLDNQLDELHAFQLTDSQVDALLLRDIETAEEGCYSNISFFQTLNGPRKAGFINMAFQMGVSGLMRFKNSLAAASDQDWESCREHLQDSRWFREDSPNRAERVIEQIYSGEYR